MIVTQILKNAFLQKTDKRENTENKMFKFNKYFK